MLTNENDRHIKNKLIIIQIKNSIKCEKCGFDKNPKCLDFHHEDVNNKFFGINDEIISKRYSFFR
jgi:hypothetical protein